MSYKIRFLSFLSAVTLAGVCNVQAMDAMDDNVGTLVVYRLPIDAARNFSQCSKRINRIVRLNKAWATFRAQFIRPEPTIPLGQALQARRCYKDYRLFELLRKDALMREQFAIVARDKANEEALKYGAENTANRGARILLERSEEPYDQETYDGLVLQEEGNESLCFQFQREVEILDEEAAAFRGDSERYFEQSRDVLREACDLGDGFAISRMVTLKSRQQPNAAVFEFLDPLVARGYVKARQLKRDILWHLKSKEEAKTLNAKLMEEGHVEAFHFAKARYPRGEKPQDFVFRDLETIKQRLASCGSETKFKEILKELRFHPKSREFVIGQIEEFNEWFVNYKQKAAENPRILDYPSVLAYTLIQKEAFEGWLKEYDACFPVFTVCQEQTEAEAQLQSKFKSLIDQDSLSEAFAFFDENRSHFTTSSQVALLLSLVPYGSAGDSLREQVVDKLRKLELKPHEIEGIYNFLYNGGGTRTVEQLAQTDKSLKRPFKIAALKFAKLMDYFQTSRK